MREHKIIFGDQILENHLKKIIYYATLAPSGHNTQPWKFSIKDNSLVIYPDYSRRLQVVDPDDHDLFISLGCALENFIIAASHMGYSAKVEYFPPTEEKDCIKVTINKDMVKIDPALFNAIPNRQATRSKYDGHPIPPEDLEKLKQVSHQDKVSFILFTEQREIERIIEFVKKEMYYNFEISRSSMN
ncbi:MAG: hypothetical protein MZU91_02475 [Desulfosudis oleivorans]|nr:hypothetical protein [Desulfosudis oleivorans]